MRIGRSITWAGLALSALIALAVPAMAQVAPTRTWDELKEEVQRRADRQVYPITGMNAADVREILASINSLDRDEWARGWSAVGERYLKQAQEQETGDKKKASESYIAAWRYFGFGAWPTQNSPGKKEAYAKSLDAFRHFARLQTPPIEEIRIPFEGKEIVGFLQLPAGPRPAPVVVSIGGLDSYKEYIVERYGATYLAGGLGYLALDMPGTGEAPIKVDVGAERIFSRVIDVLEKRPDVDAARIGLQGVSWGGHWAGRMGFTEPTRLKAVVDWAGPAHDYFQPEWQKKALATREYLFDLFAARAAVYGVSTVEDFLAYGPRMSLKDQGLIDKPSAPMLLVNGVKDSQVPIADLDLLLHHGSPKEAWVNPTGGHLGRSAEINDETILEKVIVPWFATRLAASKKQM